MSQPPSQPYHGEPYPGQPDPNQPQSGAHPGPQQPGEFDAGQGAGGYPPPSSDGQPGYPPPGYPPPSYPPPSYPPPAFPPPGGDPGFVGGYPPPVKKKSKALKIVLISLAVVLVLCIGGGAAVVFMAKDEVAGVIDAAKITVVEPATLSGRPKLTDPKFTAATAGLKAELAKAPGTTTTVGALYGDPAKKDIVMIAGASAPLLNPSKKLDDTISDASTGGLTLTELSTVDPGPLGGTAKCGNGTASGVKVAVCAWADNGSVGLIAAYFKTADELKGDFVALRGQVEQKAK